VYIWCRTFGFKQCLPGQYSHFSLKRNLNIVCLLFITFVYLVCKTYTITWITWGYRVLRPHYIQVVNMLIDHKIWSAHTVAVSALNQFSCPPPNIVDDYFENAKIESNHSKLSTFNTAYFWLQTKF